MGDQYYQWVSSIAGGKRMRKAVLTFGVVMVVAIFGFVSAQSQTAVASANSVLQATQAATMAATGNVPANLPPPVNVISGSSISVLGGAATESWTPTYIAQQNFQRGYMFWISTSKTVWVLTKTNEKDNSGVWTVYPDTFADGEAEIDPAIVPPGPGLYQPRRG